MRKLLLLLALLCVLTPVLPQRGPPVEQPVNLMPPCSATSGSCPANNYFCRSNEQIWFCTTPNVWSYIKVKGFVTTTNCTTYTSEGFACWDSDNDTLYVGDGTTAQAITGGGGSGTSVIQEEDSTVSSQATTLDFQSGFDLTESPVGEVNISLDLTEPVTMGTGVTSSFSLSSLLQGNILIYDGLDSFDNKRVTGDIAITSEGVSSINPDTVVLTTDTTGNYVASATASQGLLLTGTEAASLGFIDCAANEIMKRNAGDTAWACGADSAGSGGSPVKLDIGDDGGDDSVDLTEIATNGDTNSVVTMPLADKLYMDMSANWPTSDAADALSADPANCAANNVAAGVTIAGVAEGCVDPILETELTNEATLETQLGSIDVIVDTEINTFALLDAVVADQSLVDLIGNNTFTTGLQAVDGDADEIQLRIQGHSTQTSDIFVVEKSDGTDLFTVDNDGNTTVGGTLSSITAQSGLDLDITAASSQSITLGDGGSTNYVNITDAGVMSWTGGDVDLPAGSVDAADINAAMGYAGSASNGGPATDIATDAIASAADFNTALCANDEIIKKVSGTWDCATDSTGGTPSFDAVTSGTNTAYDMLVGTGATLKSTGTGIVEANYLEDGAGVALTCTTAQEGMIQIGTDGVDAAQAATADTMIAYCDSSTTPTLRTGYLDADGTDDDIPEAPDYTALTGGDGIDHTVTGILDVDLNATLDGTGSGGNLSGMEFTGTGELALLQGCTEGQILAWDDTNGTWDCAADAGAGTTSQVSVNGGSVMSALDLDDAGDVTFIECTGAGAPDGDCVADNDILIRYGAAKIVDADIASSTITMAKTQLTAGSDITLATNTLNVDDAFVQNDTDDTMVGELTIDSGGTAGAELTVRADGAGGGAQVGLLITTDDDDSANFDPFEIRDDSGGNNDLLFFIDHTGSVTTGIWNGTAIATANVAAALKTGSSCMYIEEPVTDEQFVSAWRAPVAVTITEIWCETDAGTVGIDLNNDTNPVNGSDISCAVSAGTSDTSFTGDATVVQGGMLDVDVGTVATAVRLSVCWRYTYD